MCHEKIMAGELQQPACTGACPTGATIFGERDELLLEAKRRIAAEPGRYIAHVWGENEVGGTSVLMISDTDLRLAGWPPTVGNDPKPVPARKVLHTVPWTFGGVAAAMFGINWITARRKKVAEAEMEEER